MTAIASPGPDPSTPCLTPHFPLFQLHRNFTHSMCEPDQMEVWCRGKEMVGMTSDQVRHATVHAWGAERRFR